MHLFRRRGLIAYGVLVMSAFAVALCAQPLAQNLYSGMRWRNIGPFRGGWGTCAAGIPGQPNVFYFGGADGGIWKTDDAGRTWNPLFQHQTTATVGALAIAPSNPDIIYAGTGQVAMRYDLASGNGVFKSTDGGKTWRGMGLADTRAIGRILVDPQNPDVVLVAALGHIFGPNPERGVFKSTDGGATWTRVLFVNDNTGAVDLAWDPQHPADVYAALWQARNYPWLSYFQPVVGPDTGLYKSTDEGNTWNRVTGNGWPTGALGRIGLAVAPGSNGQRVYASVDASSALTSFNMAAAQKSVAGFYRSGDGGASWERINGDPALASSYFGRVTADPKDPNTVYVMGQSVRRSTDGGRTFTIVKGAPGGDDYHFLWINPDRPDHMIVGSDQGTVVTVNGGQTWSSWYNQPTGQFYHLAADNQFPYWIYSGQQDSGTVGIASRSDYGTLTWREWHPVGGDERDYDIPDPEDPNIVYGSGLGGHTSRFDARTGQVADISPAIESTYGRRATDVKYRYTWITPLVASPKAPWAIYMGSQYLFKSTDHGTNWTTISPDLSRKVTGTPGCAGAVTLENAGPCGFGVIYSISISPLSNDEIWVGTDDGLIQLTRDGGKSWHNVTPPALKAWEKVSTIDASALDAATAYAAVDGHRRDDFMPHVYRTHDGGKSWASITQGLPAGSFVSVVRADPRHRGLLYAGTDGGLYVSFNDGDNWQPLQLNLPTTWVRDLLVHGDDLIAATQGRGIWILDDITPLRQASGTIASAEAHLYRPETALRLRHDENKDTPLPPETPMGKNPPPGAIFDYYLKDAATGPVTLEILDSRGDLVRQYSSASQEEKLPAFRYFAEDWLKPEQPLPSAPGHHRVAWDLRYPRPAGLHYEYSIAAVFGEDTPADPRGPLALPGQYTARLTVAGHTWSEPFTLKLDPRVHVSQQKLEEQFRVEREAAAGMNESFQALAGVKAAIRANPALETKAHPFEFGAKSFARLNGEFSELLAQTDSADTSPTGVQVEAAATLKSELAAELARWRELNR